MPDQYQGFCNDPDGAYLRANEGRYDDDDRPTMVQCLTDDCRHLWETYTSPGHAETCPECGFDVEVADEPAGEPDGAAWDRIRKEQIEEPYPWAEVYVDVETKRKELKADSLACGRTVDTEAKRITAALDAIEQPMKQIKAGVDAERERVKAEAIAAEQARIALIQGRLSNIRNLVLGCRAMDSADLERMLEHVDNIRPTEGEFHELVPDAIEVRDSVRAQLVEAIAETEAAEERRRQALAAEKAEEARRVEAHRELQERLEREAAEQAVRDKAAAAKAAAAAEIDRLRLQAEEAGRAEEPTGDWRALLSGLPPPDGITAAVAYVDRIAAAVVDTLRGTSTMTDGERQARQALYRDCERVAGHLMSARFYYLGLPQHLEWIETARGEKKKAGS